MLVKFRETIKLRVFLEAENTELLSYHRAGEIERVDQAVGSELVRRNAAIEIPDRECGIPVYNRFYAK